MSYVGDVSFGVMSRGYWLKSNANGLIYIGGEYQTVNCKPEEILEKLTSMVDGGLYDHKLWYKMPFEELSDRKALCDGNGDNMKKMIEVAKWTGLVDIFIVNGSKYAYDVVGEEPSADDIRFENSVEMVEDGEEEDDDFDYHCTPPNSDGEEEANDFVRCKRGSGILKLRQVFNGVDEFKEALVDYVLKERKNIMLSRYGHDQSGAKCGIDGCRWSIFCSYEQPMGKWMVKTYEEEHTCTADRYSKILKGGVLAKIFLDDIRNDLEMKPKAIQDQLLQRYGLFTTNDKCRKAKAKALKIIQKEHDEQFFRLKDYQTELLSFCKSNEGSTIDLETYFEDDGSEFFRRIYVCFSVVKKTWLSWCRPVFGLDGCFLKCNIKGQLLAAVGRDANNGMYHIAWAVVDVENEDNWSWFIKKLKSDLDLGDGKGFTIISDRQKGLLNAAHTELPNVEHRMCARHVYGNLKKIFPHQSDMKRMFWRLAESYTRQEYETNLEAIKGYDIRLHDVIMERNPMNCSLAFCSPKSCCVDIHNNISESFNNAIDPARYLPMIEMLEAIKRRAMIQNDVRRTKALRHQARFTPKIMEMIEVEQEKAVKFCKMILGSDGRCEVLEFGQPVSINMRTRECACRRWQMSGVPCRHALRVISEKKLNHEDYISSWFLNSTQQLIYAESIRPVNGIQYWEKCGSIILPPPSMLGQIENRIGRKPKPKRKKGRNESPTKKATRKKRVMHCGRCGLAGHNAKKCSNVGVQLMRAKKKSTHAREREDGNESNCESITLDIGEGPSQSTQPTQH